MGTNAPQPGGETSVVEEHGVSSLPGTVGAAPSSTPGTSPAPVTRPVDAPLTPKAEEVQGSDPISPGQQLRDGQQMSSANKQYNLGFKDGNLRLTTADGNRTLWESGTAAGKVQGEAQGDESGAHDASKFSMRVNPDGSMDILADGRHVWSTDAAFGTSAKLVVGDDGSLLVEDVNGNVLSTLVGKDSVKHAYLVQLQPPLGSPKALRSLLSDNVQPYLQDLVDSMGVGKAETVPDYSGLLSKTGVPDIRASGTTADSYSDKVDKLHELKGILNGKDVDVSVKISDLAPKIQDGFHAITHLIDDLKDVLRNPGSVADAPAVVKAHVVQHSDGKPDVDDFEQRNGIVYHYESQDGFAGATMLPETVQFLTGEISACVRQVETIVHGVLNIAAKTGAGVEGDAPGTHKDPGDSGAGGNGTTPGGPSTTPGANGTLPAGNPEQTGPLDFNSILDGLVPVDKSGGSPGTPSSSTDSGGQAGRPPVQSTGVQSGGGGGGDGSGLNSIMNTVMMSVMMLTSQLPALIKALTPDDSSSESKKRRDGDNPPQTDPAAPQNPGSGQPPVTPAVATEPPPVSAPVTETPAPNPASLSPVVALAVQRAQGNPNGCDARAAYLGTAGDENTNRWISIETNQVRTGDVARWDSGRTAVMVVQPTGLSMIYGGKAVAFDPTNLPDNQHGEFGNFTGFAHPSGLDAPATPKVTQVTARA